MGSKTGYRRPIETRDDLFRQVPARWALMFFAGVFFTFAPFGLLFHSALTPRQPLLAVLVLSLLSGCVAVSWAATFAISRWFIVGIVGFSLAMISVYMGPPRAAIGMILGPPSAVTLGINASIVAGYILFVLFITLQGRKTVELANEMRLARQIHETLVPPIDYEDGRMEVLGLSRASSAMGGDLVDLVRRDGSLDVYLADVSGHGVRAGVVMGMLKSAIRTRLLRGGALNEIVGDINTVLAELTSPDLFATFACMRFDESGCAETALAGHHPLIVVRADGGMEFVENEHLPLGVEQDESFTSRAITLGARDLLLCYTDGFNETLNAAGTQLGHEAICNAVVSARGRPLREIAGAIAGLADVHGAQEDDRTIVLVRLKAEAIAS